MTTHSEFATWTANGRDSYQVWRLMLTKRDLVSMPTTSLDLIQAGLKLIEMGFGELENVDVRNAESD